MPVVFVGLPDEQHHRAAAVEYLVDPSTSQGGGEVNVETVIHFNRPSQRRAGCPGEGAFSSAASSRSSTRASSALESPASI